MNCFKMIFTPKVKASDHDVLTNLLWGYMSCLAANGQILKDYTITKKSDLYYVFVTLPEDEALDEKYNNVYVSQYLCEIEDNFRIEMEMIGENIDTDISCKCFQKPEWYMLYSDYDEMESPVVCGRCGKTVPLYKIPFIRTERSNGYFEFDKEHYRILNWQGDYKVMDSLWISCLDDDFTFKQMNHVGSELSKEGRYICSEIEELTEIPCYYYLFHDKKTPENCPACGKKWKLIEKKTFIDYKCDKCRLVADEVPIRSHKG